MCGIVGILNYSGDKSIISQEKLIGMTDQIAHRGPDDHGTFISDDHRIGLGFRRLSIIDLSPAGHQPMSTTDGTIWLVFNGEIYNHQELRKDLEAKGYTYRSRTDTETILYAYKEYGIDFVHKLLGMFGIAIWDARSEELILIRDRIGIKPVYYTSQSGALFFGSEIKSIVNHPIVQREVNHQGLYDYLTLLMTPPNETLFKGIFKLEAGHFLVVNKHGDIRKEQYWDIDRGTSPVETHQIMDEQYCIDKIRQLLRDSIRARMMADVPFGVLLSGGIDSSLNVALMSELMDRPVNTFSVGYRDLEKYNELQYARQIADQFGTNHHEIFVNEDDAINFLPKMAWHLDEPNADPVCLPLYYVCQLARSTGTIVVQVGEGSDEQFSGYNHYLREIKYYKYYYSKLPRPLHKAAYHSLRLVKPESLLTDYFRRGADADAPFYGGAISFPEELKRRVLAENYLKAVTPTGNIPKYYFNQFEDLQQTSDPDKHLQRMIYYEFKNRLAELLLMRVDKMSMATSIEARVPFLDHRLVEFSYHIPVSLKIKDGVTKYILKKAAEGIIPDNIIYRRKQGFAAPISEWMRSGRLAKFAFEHIMDSSFLRDKIFKEQSIKRFFDQHAAGKANWSLQIWTMLVLVLWHDTYFNRK